MKDNYRLTVVLPEEYKRNLKMFSAQLNKNIKEILKEAIDKYMEERKEKGAHEQK